LAYILIDLKTYLSTGLILLIMKNAAFILLLSYVISSAFGQQNTLTKTKESTSSKAGIADYWINHTFNFSSVDELQRLHAGSMMGPNAGYLWPDTTILLPDGSHNSILSIGHVLNGSSPIFDSVTDGFKYSQSKSSNAYYLDTIVFYCMYNRVPSLNYSVDTLVLQLKLDQTDIASYSNQSWTLNSYGANQLDYLGISHDSAQLTSSRSDYMTFKYLLDSNSVNDTTVDGWHCFKIPIDVYLESGFTPHLFRFNTEAISISFRPGFSWNANMDSIQHVNNLRFLSYEEFGDNTYPSYFNQDYNCSYVLHKDIFYQTGDYSNFLTSDIPDSLFTPSYPFKSEHRFDHHWLEYIITQRIWGGIDTPNEFLPMQVFPNPASQSISIVVDNISTKAYLLSCYELTGKLAMQIQTSDLQHISIESLSSGMYFLIVEDAKGNQYREKLIVN
jgi:hypothetical protein